MHCIVDKQYYVCGLLCGHLLNIKKIVPHFSNTNVCYNFIFIAINIYDLKNPL
jgi:hypothetical protein